ncbi:MAG: YciI family protein, partial [Pseudanabaena sp.]
MKYAILVYETEQDIRDRPQTMPAYSAYSQALAEAGVAAGGAALHPS